MVCQEILSFVYYSSNRNQSVCRNMSMVEKQKCKVFKEICRLKLIECLLIICKKMSITQTKRIHAKCSQKCVNSWKNMYAYKLFVKSCQQLY